MDISDDFTKFLVNLLIIVFVVIMIYNIFPSLALVSNHQQVIENSLREGADTMTSDQCQDKINANANSIAIDKLKKDVKAAQSLANANKSQLDIIKKQVQQNHVDNANKNNQAAKSASKGIPS